MIAHQPRQSGAMLEEMLFLDSPRLDRVAAEQALDERAHPLVDQREQVRRGRIEAVVEIEDPAFDVRQGREHAAALDQRGRGSSPATLPVFRSFRKLNRKSRAPKPAQ